MQITNQPITAHRLPLATPRITSLQPVCTEIFPYLRSGEQTSLYLAKPSLFVHDVPSDAISNLFRERLHSGKSHLKNTPRTLEDILEILSFARLVHDKRPKLFFSLMKKAIQALRDSPSHKDAIGKMAPSQDKEDLKMLQLLAQHKSARTPIEVIPNLSSLVAPTSLPIALRFVIQEYSDIQDSFTGSDTIMNSTSAISQLPEAEEKSALFKKVYQNLRHYQEELWKAVKRPQNWQGSPEQSIPSCHDEATRAHCNLLLAYLQNAEGLFEGQRLYIDCLPDTYCKKGELRSAFTYFLQKHTSTQYKGEFFQGEFVLHMSFDRDDDSMEEMHRTLSAIILRETPEPLRPLR